MHLSFLIRGHKFWQDKFINELSTRYLSYKKYNPKTKKMDNVFLEGRLCPIQLYDFVFPKEHYDTVANTILGGYKKGKPEMKSHNKFIWALRKAMKFKKIPEWKNTSTLAMFPPQHQEIIGIGVKDDYWITEDGKHVTEKEKTEFSTEGI